MTASGYSNWELSADRANASRRELVRGGLADDKILRVVGLAAANHLDPQGPVQPGQPPHQHPGDEQAHRGSGAARRRQRQQFARRAGRCRRRGEGGGAGDGGGLAAPEQAAAK
jgi:hypothetical protein